MRADLHLRVISPSRLILDQPNVKAFACRTQEKGALEILPGHLPLVGTTEAGVIEYMVNEDVQELKLDEGILQVGNDEITLMIIETGLKSERTYGKGLNRLEKAVLSQLKFSESGKVQTC